MEESEAYFTVRDDKDEFTNKIPCRLMNPSKYNPRKISKASWDKINELFVTSTIIIRWKNTQNLLSWFDKIENKRDVAFIQFDVENFYQSILMELLYKSIQFAKEVASISDEDLDINMQSRKTLLFQEPCLKREEDEDFEVPLRCYDGTEVCELVHSHLLNKLSNTVDRESVRLYRNDGFGILRNL